MSKIEWTDVVLNPVTGCTRASAGCDNCYAFKMTKRLQEMGDKKYIGLVNDGKSHFNGVVKCHEDVLTKPLSWKKPKRVFVNSMSDLFHKDVPFEFIDKVFAVMALCPHLTFQILTKRPERMAEYFESRKLTLGELPFAVGDAMNGFVTGKMADHLDSIDAQWTWPLPNVWLGTSCENQEAANERIPHLLKCPAAVRFLSIEPQISNITLHVTDDELGAQWNVLEMGIHWVIVGGESGPGARPFDPQWALNLKAQCKSANVPFFFKQMGSNPIGVQKLNSKGSDWVGFDELRIREFPR